MAKCEKEAKKPGTTIVALLSANTTSTNWFHEHILTGETEIRFIRGRLKFSDSDVHAPFGSMIVVFGEKAVKGTIASINKQEEHYGYNGNYTLHI